MTRRIMFVDDERQILKALNRLFADTEYDVVLMNSGDEALVYLKKNNVDLIVSDIRMPEMDGFELLRYVKERYPSVMRVALSGYTDSKNIYKALEENIAKMYLFKPWDNNELVTMVNNLFALEDVLKDRRILNLINNLNDLPTLPNLFLRIKTMIRENEDVDKIAKAIEADQSTASKILRIANSAYYGSKTGSIAQAVMFIGLSNIKNIVLTSALFSNTNKFKTKIELIWKASTLTNKFSLLFYQQFIGKKIPLIFASAGLLHNIGMVVLLATYGDVYGKLLEQRDTEHKDLLALEQETMGVTHQEIGGYLLNWWEMPLPIVEVALYHHSPLDENVLNKELLCVIHLCNYMVWQRMGRKDLASDALVSRCCEFLNVDEQKMKDYFDTIEIDQMD